MLFHSANLKGLACPVCNSRAHICGNDHMVMGPVDSRRGVEMAERQELKEYSYYVGNLEHTAMLTEKMAQRLNAKPVGEASPDDVPNGGHTGDQNQRVLSNTDTRNADDNGVTGGTAPYRGAGSDDETKSRTPKNKRA